MMRGTRRGRRGSFGTFVEAFVETFVGHFVDSLLDSYLYGAQDGYYTLIFWESLDNHDDGYVFTSGTPSGFTPEPGCVADEPQRGR